jgi:hypothetical protein
VDLEVASNCYLCGEHLSTQPIGDDHVPPKQFYPESLRPKLSSPMRTIPAHAKCNSDYGRDEEYFTLSIAPLASTSDTAWPLLKERGEKHLRGKQVKLFPQVLSEFEVRPSGLHLPEGVVLKRFDGDRTFRIIWKITRGLHFHEYKQFLPEDTPVIIYELNEAGKMPAVGDLHALGLLTGRGLHPEIFDYKCYRSDDSPSLHYWAMLFWKQVIVSLAYWLPKPDLQLPPVN